MSIAKLYLFNKNTDASAAMRGYQYQVFKTLETWLDNFLNSRDETIYCDYEEDIFQHDEVTQAARFRQLKLYSSNFSFSSEEIKKALAHFFMLHVKTDHAAKDKEFVFEANSRVADFREGNQADLLRRWVADQEAMPDALLGECAKQVKTVVSKFIQDRAQELEDQLAEREKKSAGDADKLLQIQNEQHTLQEALAVFHRLTDGDWDAFTRSIKWQFEGVAPADAFAGTIRRIEEQIAELPFDIPQARQEGMFGVLCKRVVIKASESEPENRTLIGEELRGLILENGTEEEQWYQEVFTKWSQARQPDDFRLGEFYEVLKAVKFCRWSKNLMSHDAFWFILLDWYIAHLAGQPGLRKSAIYERVMLQLRPMEYLTPPSGDLMGSEGFVREYFQDLTPSTDITDFENTQSLLMIVWAVVGMGKAALEPTEVAEWQRQHNELMEQQFAQTANPAERCRLLESRFNRLFVVHSRARTEEIVAELLAPLEELYSQVKTATLYDASQLSSRLHTLIKLLIQVDETENELVIEALRDYVRRLDKEVVQEKKGAHQAARQLVAEGMEYLKSSNRTALLKALRDFHDAKDRWLQAETFEGYTLALLNIAQVYSAMDMHFAAKYYGLWAAWVSWQKGSRELLKRIAQGYGMAFHADFTQGAWFSALLDFEFYIMTRHEFDTQPLDAEEAEMPRKIITDYGFILYAAPVLAPHLQALAQAKLTATGYLKEDYLDELLAMLQTELPEPKLREGLVRNFTDAPLSDMGSERTIRFHALGMEWHVHFLNNYELTALGEEFCAMLQILLAEIALSKADFHLPQGIVDITLELTTDVRPPEQLLEDQKSKWKVFVQHVESTDFEVVKLGIAWVTIALRSILHDISLLPVKEFDEAFWGLFSQGNLASKSMQVTSYQRMYRSMFSKESFDDLFRHLFSPVEAVPGFPNENAAMQLKAGLSKKYNQADALRLVAKRFKKVTRNLHVTLARLKQDAGFGPWLEGLRSEGWQDWMILWAMMTFMVNYKAQKAIEGRQFASGEEEQKALAVEFRRIIELDEIQAPGIFPLQAFQSRGFKRTLSHTPIAVLESFGLENKARVPNPKAVKKFLDERFNVQVDNDDEHNPLL
ncbi:hypothetical protein [Hymenobacter nivis]|uniref:DUF4297 domain-containing protein n=1 Tax=Hymenobacter nivis TaxID=1850093 RepID=A0A502GT40_9BACT|nr:hypothetical protein [Hymenobacter nivis]TPG64632.1 hypothetical protein EAH73_15830 [Hymenobacter nivis]